MVEENRIWKDDIFVVKSFFMRDGFPSLHRVFPFFSHFTPPCLRGIFILSAELGVQYTPYP